MTRAICYLCGEEKHGALTPCRHCRRGPATEIEAAFSLALSDHFVTIEELGKIGAAIKNGQRPTISEKNREHFLTMVREQKVMKMLARYRR